MAARSGMGSIISQVRQLAAIGTADYSAGGATYWTDDQLQTILDRVRVELWEEPIEFVPLKDTGGTVRYKEARTTWTWLEATTGGTAIFFVANSAGSIIGSANYTVDYQYGRFTFGADQAGSVRYLTARSYDVYEVAARVWEQKAAHVAQRFDFDADGASFKASQMLKNYKDMAKLMRSQSRTGGVSHASMYRGDLNCEPDWDTGVRGTRVTY